MSQHFGIDASVLTYEDYRNAPDDQRYELLDGALVVLPTPNIAHQRGLGDLSFALHDFVREKRVGAAFLRVAVVLSDTNVVEPDIAFVSSSRMDIVETDNIRGAPDLVVEIVSPNNPERDLVRKRDIYARHGVGEYWIVDPEARSIRVMALEGNGYRMAGEYGERDVLESGALEGIELEVGGAFSAPTPESGQGAQALGWRGGASGV